MRHLLYVKLDLSRIRSAKEKLAVKAGEIAFKTWVVLSLERHKKSFSNFCFVLLNNCDLIPTFELGSDEIEFGVGIHGEPGRRREKFKSAHDLSDDILNTSSKFLWKIWSCWHEFVGKYCYPY